MNKFKKIKGLQTVKKKSCALLYTAGLVGVLSSTALADLNGFGASVNPSLYLQQHNYLNIAEDTKAADERMTQGAKDFIDSMAKRGLGFLAADDLSTSEKKKRFEGLLHDSFDMKTIGRFALGRYWRTSSKAQQDEYLDLFEELILEVYAGRFDDYSGQRFEVRQARKNAPNDVLVSSYIMSPSDPEVQVDWRVRYKNGKYKIIDIIVEGVSMSVTQRSDFSSVIQRGGGDIQVLIDDLKTKLASK